MENKLTLSSRDKNVPVFPEYFFGKLIEKPNLHVEFYTNIRKKHDDGIYYLIPIRINNDFKLSYNIEENERNIDSLLRQSISIAYRTLLWWNIDPAWTVEKEGINPYIYIDEDQTTEFDRHYKNVFKEAGIELDNPIKVDNLKPTKE